MNLKHLTDETLLADTKALVRKEKDLLVQILHHLQEIETRKLFAVLRCPSLFEYCVRHLNYSESQAQRRISSMRLLRQIPSLEESIESGRLTLSNMAMAQTIFRSQNIKNPNEKITFIKLIENTSRREAEKIASSYFPEMEKFRKQIVVSETLESKLQKLRGLYAHKFADLQSLLEYLCDEEIQRLEKDRRVNPLAPAQVKPRQKRNREQLEGEQKRTRYVPKEVQRFVWQRDRGSCANCGSGSYLQYDHIQPFSLGGPTSVENLRLLCRNCNQRSAVEKLGIQRHL